MSNHVITLATVLVPVTIAVAGISGDAWRRARSNDEQLDDVEAKLDVLLMSLGIDPEEPPEYDIELDVSRRNGGGQSVGGSDDD